MNYSLNEKESARKSLLPSFPINLASSGLLIVACQRIPIFLSSHWAICVTTSSISRMVSLVELNLIYFYFSLYKIPLPQWITSEIKSFVWGWQRLPGCQRVKRWKVRRALVINWAAVLHRPFSVFIIFFSMSLKLCSTESSFNMKLNLFGQCNVCLFTLCSTKQLYFGVTLSFIWRGNMSLLQQLSRFFA